MMTLREGIACLVAAAGVLLAVGFYRHAAETERNAEVAKEDLAARNRNLQEQVNAAAAARTAEPPPPTQKEKPVEKEPDAAPELAAVAPESPSAGAITGLPIFGDSARMRQALAKHIEELYGDFLDSCGLQGEDRRKVVEALVDRDMKKSSPTFVMETLGQGVSSRADLAQRFQDRDRQLNEDVNRQLTPGQATALQQYDQTVPDRRNRLEADREISATGADPSRTPFLRNALYEEKKRESREDAEINQATCEQDRPRFDASMDSKRQSDAQMRSQARSEMNDDEYDQFCEQRDAKLNAYENNYQTLGRTRK